MKKISKKIKWIVSIVTLTLLISVLGYSITVQPVVRVSVSHSIDIISMPVISILELDNSVPVGGTANAVSLNYSPAVGKSIIEPGDAVPSRYAKVIVTNIRSEIGNFGIEFTKPYIKMYGVDSVATGAPTCILSKVGFTKNTTVSATTIKETYIMTSNMTGINNGSLFFHSQLVTDSAVAATEGCVAWDIYTDADNYRTLTPIALVASYF